MLHTALLISNINRAILQLPMHILQQDIYIRIKEEKQQKEIYIKIGKEKKKKYWRIQFRNRGTCS